MVPHITNEIKERMQLLGNSGDFDISDHRDWRNRRGHRVFTLHRIRPTTDLRVGRGECDGHPPDVDPLSIGCRGAENQAHATLGQNLDGKWDQSGCVGL